MREHLAREAAAKEAERIRRESAEEVRRWSQQETPDNPDRPPQAEEEEDNPNDPTKSVEVPVATTDETSAEELMRVMLDKTPKRNLQSVANALAKPVSQQLKPWIDDTAKKLTTTYLTANLSRWSEKIVEKHFSALAENLRQSLIEAVERRILESDRFASDVAAIVQEKVEDEVTRIDVGTIINNVKTAVPLAPQVSTLGHRERKPQILEPTQNVERARFPAPPGPPYPEQTVFPRRLQTDGVTRSQNQHHVRSQNDTWDLPMEEIPPYRVRDTPRVYTDYPTEGPLTGMARRNPVYGEDPTMTLKREEAPVWRGEDDSHSPQARYPFMEEDATQQYLRQGEVDTPGLPVLKPTNFLYAELVDYRYYRLMDRSQTYDATVAKKIGRKAKSMQSQLLKRFKAKDPIMVLDFLDKFKLSCDHNGVHEGMALWLFQFFLAGSVHTAVMDRISHDTHGRRRRHAEALHSYSAVVNFLLKQYATDEAISEAHTDLITARQSSGMSEEEFSSLLQRKNRRCGNVMTTDAMKSLFVEGLLGSIRALVRTYSHNHPEKSLDDIVRYATGQGDAQRGRRAIKPIPPEGAALRNRRNPKKSTRVAYAAKADSTSSSSSSESTESDPDESGTDGEAFALASRSTVSFPTTPTLTTRTQSSVHASPTPARLDATAPHTRANDMPRADGTYRRCLLCRSATRPCCAPMMNNPVLRETLLKQRDLHYQLEKNTRPWNPQQRYTPYGGMPPQAGAQVVGQQPLQGRVNPGGNRPSGIATPQVMLAEPETEPPKPESSGKAVKQ